MRLLCESIKKAVKQAAGDFLYYYPVFPLFVSVFIENSIFSRHIPTIKHLSLLLKTFTELAKFQSVRLLGTSAILLTFEAARSRTDTPFQPLRHKKSFRHLHLVGQH